MGYLKQMKNPIMLAEIMTKAPQQELYDVVNKFIDVHEVEKIVDPRQLGALLVYLDLLMIKVTDITIQSGLDGGDQCYVGIHLDGSCDWGGWGYLATIIKGKMVSEGFVNLASKTVIICDHALNGEDR